KARRLLDRHVGRLCAPCNLVDIVRDIVERPHEVEAVADQRTRFHVLAECRDRRDAALEQGFGNGRAVAQKDRAGRQDDGLAASIRHCAECAGVIPLAAEFDHARLQAELARGLRRRIALFARRRIESHSDDACARKRLARDLDPLGRELELAHEDAGHVPPGARETGYVALRKRVEIDGQKRDRPALRNREGSLQRVLVADREEHVDLARCELAIVCFVALNARGLDVVEGKVAAFLIAELGHAPEKASIERRLPRLHADKADAQLLRLLRGRRARPNDGGAGRGAEERDESTGRHSMTSSARARRSGGTVNPSALAVRRLMTNSKWIGCSTGRSAGWAPLRILSTYAAALR